MSATLSDAQLLREFATSRSQSAFRELVERHQNMVFATARRRLGNDEAAADVTQLVFLALANKAVWLAGKTTVGGWLYKSTLLEAARRQRDECRRVNRERLYAEEMNLNPSSETDEEALRAKRLMPVLDDAMSELSELDREAILLRFMQGMSLRDTGAALGTTEEAARKRVSRALDKLSGLFKRKGVSVTTAALAATVLPFCAKASAPAALAGTISATAAKVPATGLAGSLYLIALGLTKMQAVAACLLAASIPVAIQARRISELRSSNLELRSELARKVAVVQPVIAEVEASAPVSPPSVNSPTVASGKSPDKTAEQKREHNGWQMWQKWQREARLSALWERLGLDEHQLTAISSAMERADADQRAIFEAARKTGEKVDSAQLSGVTKTLDESIVSFLTDEQAGGYQQFCDEEERNRQEIFANRQLSDWQGLLHLSEQQKDKLYSLFLSQAGRQTPGSFPKPGSEATSEEDARQLSEILTTEQYRLWKERADVFGGMGKRSAPPPPKLSK